jgi:hypothetical protein
MLGLEYGKHRPLSTAVTGNLDTLVAGTITGVSSVRPQTMVLGTLSALVILDAETNTITLSAVWQVSDDGSTWYRVSGAPNNPADVVMATGTGGADASVTTMIPALPLVHAWKYARIGILNLVATGAAVDTYSVQYKFVSA